MARPSWQVTLSVLVYLPKFSGEENDWLFLPHVFVLVVCDWRTSLSVRKPRIVTWQSPTVGRNLRVLLAAFLYRVGFGELNWTLLASVFDVS